MAAAWDAPPPPLEDPALDWLGPLPPPSELMPEGRKPGVPRKEMLWEYLQLAARLHRPLNNQQQRREPRWCES